MVQPGSDRVIIHVRLNTLLHYAKMEEAPLWIETSRLFMKARNLVSIAEDNLAL